MSKLFEMLQSFFSSAPDSMSTGRLCAVLLIVANIVGTLYLLWFKKSVPTDILIYAEATALLVLVSLFPSKIIDAIRQWKNPKG